MRDHSIMFKKGDKIVCIYNSKNLFSHYLKINNTYKIHSLCDNLLVIRLGNSRKSYQYLHLPMDDFITEKEYIWNTQLKELLDATNI